MRFFLASLSLLLPPSAFASISIRCEGTRTHYLYAGKAVPATAEQSGTFAAFGSLESAAPGSNVSLEDLASDTVMLLDWSEARISEKSELIVKLLVRPESDGDRGSSFFEIKLPISGSASGIWDRDSEQWAYGERFAVNCRSEIR